MLPPKPALAVLTRIAEREPRTMNRRGFSIVPGINTKPSISIGSIPLGGSPLLFRTGRPVKRAVRVFLAAGARGT